MTAFYLSDLHYGRETLFFVLQQFRLQSTGFYDIVRKGGREVMCTTQNVGGKRLKCQKAFIQLIKYLKINLKKK